MERCFNVREGFTREQATLPRGMIDRVQGFRIGEPTARRGPRISGFDRGFECSTAALGCVPIGF
jgi:hypothetical protein